ncbi:Outer membrane protein beta-barrel domain-containing protein [Lutibacter agarilyticus]|uniref:Outer membrane protein beta-barrel domain-containing protein n=1 Tax=Lutibacter agarilyticus TaxID=1109740 RepID=A0A238VFH6_9FLAO|nr:porin family protein [Lutibacter agarilyticus]SNR32269.1 Outer membrane protein beta-barrel domain-containing protein [Lutibacter agarilyticus]
MKKIILTVFIVVFTMVSVQGQAEIGIKAGVNFASIMGDTPRGLRFRTAYDFGLVAEFETSPSTAVQPEIMYSSQGFHYDGGIINGESIAEDNYKLDYLNIPLVFKYYFSEGASFEVGPQVGFLLSAKTADDTINNGDLRDNLTNASFDFLVGFGYKFDNGFNLNARYVGGLTNIWKGYNRNPPPGYWYYDYGKRNSVFQLTVGYYFN